MRFCRVRQLVCVALAATVVFAAFTPIQQLIATAGDLDSCSASAARSRS